MKTIVGQDDPMDIHAQFAGWALQQGVKLNGIICRQFPGRGLGVVAKKDFKADEVILTVPITASRTIHTVPKAISQKLPKGTTTHSLLATELCLDRSSHHQKWRNVLPTKKDFTESVPLLWDEKLQDLLPSAAKVLLENQKRKLKIDWTDVEKTFPQIKHEEYMWRWLIVNTRTFYYLDPKSKKTPARDDCMALNPFADYINHSSHGSTVSFSHNAYTITTTAPITKGDEIYISYGNHSNDFLLAEYGFIMDDGTNEWDQVSLDPYISKLLSEEQKEELEERGFLGGYVLDAKEVCYKTQVALRIMCVPVGRWRRFVEGKDDDVKEEKMVQEKLSEVLRAYRVDVGKNLMEFKGSDIGLECQRDTLTRRWKQIDALLEAAIKRIK